ncbi:hypothetical protein [Sulfuricurvum sp.]|uniref:hypothetical protein n=1 Tax=Sulfuricurvum sp. TaxID=2025608 RepID=UPI0025CFC1AC|nr:hypothetical protein [Sulfuricurvum sp.]
MGKSSHNPLVEKSLTSALSTPITIQEFVLTRNRFHLLFQDGYGNTFSTQGGFSLLTLRMYAHYRLKCFQYGGFNPLPSPLKAEGSLNGGIASFMIHGYGNVFGGNVLYKIELHRFQLASVDLNVDKIFYLPLMQMLHYPSDTDTTLSGDILLNGFDQRDVEGKIHLLSQTRRFVSTPISEESNESFTLKSLLADKYGDVQPFNVNITLDASLAHAGILEQFVGIPLGGTLNLHAALSGDEKLLHLKTHTDVARSDTSMVVDIPRLEPSRIAFDFKHADLEKIFTLFAHNAPISGQGDMYGELNTTGGNLNIIITKAATVPKVLFQEYHITQPLTRFDAEVHADLSQKGVRYRASYRSDLNRMEIDSTTTHNQMLRDLLLSIPNGSPHR